MQDFGASFDDGFMSAAKVDGLDEWATSTSAVLPAASKSAADPFSAEFTGNVAGPDPFADGTPLSERPTAALETFGMPSSDSFFGVPSESEAKILTDSNPHEIDAVPSQTVINDACFDLTNAKDVVVNEPASVEHVPVAASDEMSPAEEKSNVTIEEVHEVAAQQGSGVTPQALNVAEDHAGAASVPVTAPATPPSASRAEMLSTEKNTLPAPITPPSQVVPPTAAPAILSPLAVPTESVSANDGGGGIKGLVSPSSMLPNFTAPNRPEAPHLMLATINSLTVAWPEVPGATGYYCDYECRTQTGTDDHTASASEWTGTSGRVVSRGSALLESATCKITGLQKNADYVVRVIAVRKRRVVLPDGTALEQVLESEPSETSGFLRTLNPRAEIARLTGKLCFSSWYWCGAVLYCAC